MTWHDALLVFVGNAAFFYLGRRAERCVTKRRQMRDWYGLK